jgi:levanbiose-producing levanase
MQSRQAIAWMNNWDYARKLPTQDWHGGMDSIVRDLRLKTVQGRPTVVSSPSQTLARLEGQASTIGPETITPDGTPRLPPVQGGAYRLDLTLERAGTDDGSEARLQLESGGKAFATVGYNFQDEAAFVGREPTATAADLGALFRERRTASAPARNGTVDLTVFVDHSSVEVFVNGGEQTLTSLVFPNSEQQGIKLVTGGGNLTVKTLTYAPLSSTR